MTWEGGSAEANAFEQDALDLAINGDNFPGWMRATIGVDGRNRRISSMELHQIATRGPADQDRARDLLAVVLRRRGLFVE